MTYFGGLPESRGGITTVMDYSIWDDFEWIPDNLIEKSIVLIKPPVLYRAAELFRDGHTVRQVADLLGVSRSEAGRLRLKAAADGIVGAVGEDESEDLEAAVDGRFRLN
jgi:hypothetical protein